MISLPDTTTIIVGTLSMADTYDAVRGDAAGVIRGDQLQREAKRSDTVETGVTRVLTIRFFAVLRKG